MSAKKSGTGLLLLSLIVPLLSSCEFEPGKVYERTVNENVLPPKIQVVELNLDYDTIYLYAQKQIHFNFVSDNQEILAVRFTVDDEEKYLVNSSSGIFELNYRVFTSGYHTLKLEVYTASGSGSIAEHLGAEGFLFSKSWVLAIDQGFYSYINSVISDGFLKLSWDRYRGYDFKEYVIYTGGGPGIEIARVKSNYFIVNSFVGEVVRYDVKVITDDGAIIPWGFMELEKNLPKLYFTASGTNQYTVKWDKSKYYGAVDRVILYQMNNTPMNYTQIKETSNPDDTTYAITSSFFGDEIVLKLKIIPRNNIRYNPENYSLFESYNFNIRLGFPFGRTGIYDIQQVSEDEFIYIARYDSLVRYSVSQKRTVQKLGYQPTGCSTANFINMRISPSGKFLTAYVDCNNDVMLANSGNLGNHTIRNLKFLSGQMYVPEIPVSDAGIVIVNNINGGFYLYDFNTASTIAFHNKDVFTLQGLSLSLNGDYMFIRHDSLRLVHFNGLEFINIWSHSRFAEPEFYEFDGKDPGRLVIWNGSILSLKKCSDFSTIYEFPLTDGKILDINYYNNEMLTFSNGYLFVRSFTDGSLLHTVPYNQDPNFWYFSCYLVNHAIICNQGVIYFLE